LRPEIPRTALIVTLGTVFELDSATFSPDSFLITQQIPRPYGARHAKRTMAEYEASKPFEPTLHETSISGSRSTSDCPQITQIPPDTAILNRKDLQERKEANAETQRRSTFSAERRRPGPRRAMMSPTTLSASLRFCASALRKGWLCGNSEFRIPNSDFVLGSWW